VRAAVKAGKIKYAEQFVKGIENGARSLPWVLKGKTSGKL